jgi:hypothetical protein
MSDVSCVIFYAGKMLQTIEFPLNINLFEGPLFLENEAILVIVNLSLLYF